MLQKNLAKVDRENDTKGKMKVKGHNECWRKEREKKAAAVEGIGKENQKPKTNNINSRKMKQKLHRNTN